MHRAANNVHKDENRVSYTMNGFIIGAGGFIEQLTELAMELGSKIGKVKVDVGETSCKVPEIHPYLQNMIDRCRIGKRKKMARC